jgi:hypothetical protein
LKRAGDSQLIAARFAFGGRLGSTLNLRRAAGVSETIMLHDFHPFVILEGNIKIAKPVQIELRWAFIPLIELQ